MCDVIYKACTKTMEVMPLELISEGPNDCVIKGHGIMPRVSRDYALFKSEQAAMEFILEHLEDSLGRAQGQVDNIKTTISILKLKLSQHQLLQQIG